LALLSCAVAIDGGEPCPPNSILRTISVAGKIARSSAISVFFGLGFPLCSPVRALPVDGLPGFPFQILLVFRQSTVSFARVPCDNRDCRRGLWDGRTERFCRKPRICKCTVRASCVLGLPLVCLDVLNEYTAGSAADLLLRITPAARLRVAPRANAASGEGPLAPARPRRRHHADQSRYRARRRGCLAQARFAKGKKDASVRKRRRRAVGGSSATGNALRVYPLWHTMRALSAVARRAARQSGEHRGRGL
jgi:hypothetical protein